MDVGVTIATVPTDTNSGDTPTLTHQEYFEERKLLLGARQRGYQEQRFSRGWCSTWPGENGLIR